MRESRMKQEIRLLACYFLIPAAYLRKHRASVCDVLAVAAMLAFLLFIWLRVV
jgi:hypothetical protein